MGFGGERRAKESSEGKRGRTPFLIPGAENVEMCDVSVSEIEKTVSVPVLGSSPFSVSPNTAML